jgi:hypothetical protein
MTYSLYFVYSFHKTRAKAEQALETYFASGIVSEGERPRVARCGKAWAVMFPG